MNKAVEIYTTREVLGREFDIYGDFENPMIKAQDVAEWIEHTNTRKMLNNVDEDEKMKGILGVTNSYGQNKQGGMRANTEVWFLTEDGVYEVLMQSRKPIAKKFKKQVKRILKEIRMNGYYMRENATKKQYEEMINDAKVKMNELELIVEVQKSEIESKEKTIFLLKREWNNFCDLKAYYGFKWNATTIKSTLQRHGYIEWVVGENDEDLVVEFTNKGLKRFGNGTWRTYNCGYKDEETGKYIPKRTIQFNKHGLKTIKDIFFELGY